LEVKAVAALLVLLSSFVFAAGRQNNGNIVFQAKYFYKKIIKTNQK
jgi:hypothetical protein